MGDTYNNEIEKLLDKYAGNYKQYGKDGLQARVPQQDL
jgi:hypothetical protein